MEGTQLEVVEEEKDIGVIVHRSLKPSRQCKKAAGIATAVLRQLARNFHYRDKNTFKNLYVRYVRPHLEFATPAWSPWLKEDKDVLEKVQRKTIGMISGLKTKTYEERCKELGLETLEARRERQDLLETYKIREKQGKTNTGRLLLGNHVRTGAVTRSGADPNNIAVQRPRLDIRKYNFSVRAPETWNKLPSELKASETIKEFN